MKKIIIFFQLTLHLFSILIKVGNQTDNTSIFYPNIYDALMNQTSDKLITILLVENTFINKNLEIFEKNIEI